MGLSVNQTVLRLAQDFFGSALDRLGEPTLLRTEKSATTVKRCNHISLFVFSDFIMRGHKNGHPAVT
jgi:hypothetical protein